MMVLWNASSPLHEHTWKCCGSSFIIILWSHVLKIGLLVATFMITCMQPTSLLSCRVSYVFDCFGDMVAQGVLFLVHCSTVLLSDDLNRVVLRQGRSLGSDYINASFIDVCR